jgi:hypothetical protein
MPILCEAEFDASSTPSVSADKPAEEMLFLICFTRYPAELRRELVSGSPLAPFREALTAAGYSFETPSGAKIFCAVNQYEAVLAAMEKMDVRPYHVVVSQSCRELVGRTVEKLPKALKVRIKDENVCEMVPAGIVPTRGMPEAKPSRGKWSGKSNNSTTATDSTSDGGSSGEDPPLPALTDDAAMLMAGAPVFNLTPEEMAVPYGFYNDLLWAQGGALFHEWVQALQNEHGPIDMPAPFPDQLAWQMAELLKAQEAAAPQPSYS